jgi:predicted HAD superfamily Cof-like phosphohydrolase
VFDGEWDRHRTALGKVEELLESLRAAAQQEEMVGGADAPVHVVLQEVADAQKTSDETAKQESQERIGGA